METTLTARKTQFLGVIGDHLIELLDSDPFTQRFLRGTGASYHPSNESRFTGKHQRMVLRTFDRKALLVFTGDLSDNNPNRVLIKIFINKSTLDDTTLLWDGLKLAAHRFRELSHKGHTFSLSSLTKQPQRETLAILSLLTS